ncbi:MAG: hypothetical protein NVSMB25_25810 [Thermoleophilaceae bacterium]
MVTTLSGMPARFAGGLQEVGPGVWAWLQPNGTWGESNAGLIAGEGASLLVDTLFDERLTRRMLEAMAAHTASAPVRFVVNTHSDGDHWWGNGLVPAGAEIVTSDASLEAMGYEDPAELARFRGLSGVAARLPGAAGVLGGYVREMLRPFSFAGLHPRIADQGFSGEAEREVGGRIVRLIEVGPAHTVGDSIVHLPDAGVVFAADILFVGSTPVMWAGPVASWVRALDTLVGLEASIYVPGHGPLASLADIEIVREYLEWLEQATRQRHACGDEAGDAARAIARSPQFERAPWRHWDAPERLVISVDTIYRRLEGAGARLSPLETVRLFARVGRLGRELAAGSGRR